MLEFCRVRGAARRVRFGIDRRGALPAAFALSVLLASPASADPAPPAQDWSRTETRDDCANYNPLRQPFFGETHVHTRYSADAVLARTRNDPYDAYNFAKGGTVGLPPYDGMDVPARTVTIDRPLDFTAVTDHAEGFGEANICLDVGYSGYNDPICQNLRATFLNDYQPTNPLPQAFVTFFLALQLQNPSRFSGICGSGPGYADCMTEAGIVWQDTQDAAEANYDRTSACTFTTFNAYEWSGQTSGNNLHRNIIFRNDEVPALPISYYEKWKAEDMRAELKAQCLDAPGNCDVLAIPHNSNMATDKMFHNRTTDNGVFTLEYAKLRASLERIMELTQVKGDSECRDGVVGTTDELCTFENNTTANILTGKLQNDSQFSQYAYARGGLKRGLQLGRQLGVNPFELGFIGSTDTHNGVPGAVSEIDYGHIGQTGIADSTPAFILSDATQPSKVELNPGGLAVVWAEENSRDAIFAAMRRRETYSTTGTRPIVRVFGGRLRSDLCTNMDLDFAAEGYDKGVPMGGDLGPARGKKSPRFAVLAIKDPGTMDRPGTPLQRAQIVKGWRNADSSVSEKVYDIAGNPNNGAGVNLDTCEETGTGFSSLCAVWEDPDFDPTENAFYYVRVVENPVCRWHKRLCNDLRTCSVQLSSCSLDPTRTCTVNADCSAYQMGSTCTLPYTGICTSDADCEAIGAGTCGATPAVDCNNLGTVPAAAAECCDMANPWTIQERAVASPIYYHPEYVGLAKGKILFKDTPSSDSLLFGLMIPDAPAQLDPATHDLVLTLRDDATAWSATIPAGTMETKKAGASYLYKDKLGTIGGITLLKVTIKKDSAKITLKAGKIDLSGIDRESQKLSFDLTATDNLDSTYTSTAEREWNYKSLKLLLAN
jgi:hypothetical protein